MTTPARSPHKTTTSSRTQPRSGPSRRRLLSAVATAGLGGLAGCMNIFGASEESQGDTTPVDASTTAPEDRPDSATSNNPASASPTVTDDPTATVESTPAVRTDGPVDSPPSNESPYDDPDDGLSLTGVTVQVAGERRRDSMLRLADQLTIEVKGDRFEVRGRGHVEWECDTVGLRTVVVDGRHARVYAETREVDSCRTPDNPAGRGPWAISFSIDGRFEGGRPDALTASIQGSFIDDSGVLATESL